MSGLTRYLTSAGLDLSSVFMPLSFGQPYPIETGYKLSTGVDLNTVFCKKYSSTAANNTSLLLSDGQDLSDVFDKLHTTGYTGIAATRSDIIRVAYPFDQLNVYVGGDNGLVSKWNGSTFTNLAALNNSVRGIYTKDTTNLYMGGLFSNAGYTYFAKWNGTTYSSVGGTIINNTVFGMFALDPSNVYIGGFFTNGGAIGSRVSKLNTHSDTFSALGSTALNNTVRAIYALDPSNVYIGGAFTNGGTIGDGITRWDGTQFNKVGTGVGPAGSSAAVYAIYALDTSHVYIGGLFTSFDGVAGTSKIAMFNGTSFEPLGTGLGGTQVQAIYASDPYHVYVGGVGINAMWNGNTFIATSTGAYSYNYINSIQNNNSLLYIGASATSSGGVMRIYIT